jgi:hypothetical protein
VIPFLALILAYSLSIIVTQWQNRLRAPSPFGVAAAVMIPISVLMLQRTIIEDITLAGEDTRTIAREWILANIPPNSGLLLEQFDPQLPKDRFRFYQIDEEGSLYQWNADKDTFGSNFRPQGDMGFLRDVSELEAHNVGYFVLSNRYPRYQLEREVYPEIVETYDQLIASAELIFEVLPIPLQRNGVPIQVYRMNF